MKSLLLPKSEILEHLSGNTKGKWKHYPIKYKGWIGLVDEDTQELVGEVFLYRSIHPKSKIPEGQREHYWWRFTQWRTYKNPIDTTEINRSFKESRDVIDISLDQLFNYCCKSQNYWGVNDILEFHPELKLFWCKWCRFYVQHEAGQFLKENASIYEVLEGSKYNFTSAYNELMKKTHFIELFKNDTPLLNKIIVFRVMDLYYKRMVRNSGLILDKYSVPDERWWLVFLREQFITNPEIKRFIQFWIRMYKVKLPKYDNEGNIK